MRHIVVNVVACPLRLVVGLVRIDHWDQRRILIDKHLVSVVLSLKNILMPLGCSIWVIFFEILKRSRLQMSRRATIGRTLTNDLHIWHSGHEIGGIGFIKV